MVAIRIQESHLHSSTVACRSIDIKRISLPSEGSVCVDDEVEEWQVDVVLKFWLSAPRQDKSDFHGGQKHFFLPNHGLVAHLCLFVFPSSAFVIMDWYSDKGASSQDNWGKLDVKEVGTVNS